MLDARNCNCGENIYVYSTSLAAREHYSKAVPGSVVNAFNYRMSVIVRAIFDPLYI